MTIAEKKAIYENDLRTNGMKEKDIVDYMKDVSDIAMLNDGYYVVFKKPTIQKDFCFGYGYGGYDTCSDAAKAAEDAEKSEKYFIDQNLEEFNNMLENIGGRGVRTLGILIGAYRSEKKCVLEMLRPDEVFDGVTEFRRKCRVLTDSEKETIRETILSEKEKFAKRLATYLKRYGTKKIHTWSYWMDE